MNKASNSNMSVKGCMDLYITKMYMYCFNLNTWLAYLLVLLSVVFEQRSI